MAKFNKDSNMVGVTTNLAGGTSYSLDKRQELVFSCLTSFLEDKYYESGDTRRERIAELVKANDPIFVAKLAILARRSFHLRSIPVVLIGELSRIHRGDSLVRRLIKASVERVDDLTELIAYLGKPLPNQVKKGVSDALIKFSSYQLAKYKAEGKAVSLVDVFNLCHPDPSSVSSEQRDAWGSLINGTLKSTDTWEARLSSGEDKKTVWTDLIVNDKIGYMALLRNLRNIISVCDDDVIAIACDIISDPDRVHASKQLPFRYYSAYEALADSPRRDVMDAISRAMDLSLDNIPPMDGSTLVAVDCSASMMDDTIEKAAVFGAGLVRKHNADLILYDTKIIPIHCFSSDAALTTANRIVKYATGGGTQTSLVFKHATDTGKKYDRIIILSDNESWVETSFTHASSRIKAAYEQYRRKVSDCTVYAIDMAGYGTVDIIGSRVYNIAGWSEHVFDFIWWAERRDNLCGMIDNVEIPGITDV